MTTKGKKKIWSYMELDKSVIEVLEKKEEEITADDLKNEILDNYVVTNNIKVETRSLASRLKYNPRITKRNNGKVNQYSLRRKF